MKPVPTRTLNPLPFGDLEPHRFEDLIRQLAYELRRWKSLEATGRAGSDSGIDIRGIELVPIDEEAEEDDENTETAFVERLWVFQCKREKTLPPKRLRNVIEESLASLVTPPHGFILAVACDVSKEARDAFREEMVTRGIEEFLIWAKGELEDMLFQPRNDRLLFAYFGIALQPRRRSLSTTLRSEITKKKQLTALIGEEDKRDGKLVLLRDPTDERYPRMPKPSDSPPRWLLCRALTLKKPGYLVVLQHEYLAATSSDGTQWDAIFDYDLLPFMAQGDLQSAGAWGLDNSRDRDRSPHDFWNEYIDESHQMNLKIRRAVPLDRILALDPLGDGWFPVPHILVDFTDTTGPFTADRYPAIEGSRHMDRYIDIDLSDDNRASIFPKPLPAEGDQVPKGFDQTNKKALPLSAAAGEKFQSLLAKVIEGKKALIDAEDSAAAKTREAEESRKMREFQLWREDVAQPVFSSFVHQLRAAGQRARVVIQREPIESVELRAQFLTSHYNPSGHIRVSFQQHGMGWRMDISPTAEAARGRSSSSPTIVTTPSSETTKEQLEALVLEMLERLDRYLK